MNCNGEIMSQLTTINFKQWIEEHRHLLKPPVGNQQIWENTGMMVTIIGGPNKRTDYHDDPVEEFFYQIEGDMELKIYDNDKFYHVTIHEGEIFFLPAHVRHSPQRPMQGSIGLVIEPKRPDGEKDAFEWYCFECSQLVHRAEVLLKSIVRDLPPLYEHFYSDKDARTCPNCKTIHPGKDPPVGWVELSSGDA